MSAPSAKTYRRLIVAAVLLQCGGAQAPTFHVAPSGKPASNEIVFVDYLENIFRERYAPTLLKQASFGWNLESEIEKLRALALRNPPPSPREWRRALYEFFRAPRDLHTGISFDPSPTVWLGFHVKRTADGRYRLAWIDRHALPTNSFPFESGDEVVSFDGVAIAEAVEATHRATLWSSTPAFDQAFGEWLLSVRGDEWPVIPKPGDVARLEIRSGSLRTVSVPWLDLDKIPPTERCPFWGKTRKSYLSEFRDTTWRTPEANFFPASIFRVEQKKYGYLRIHTYQVEPARQPDAIRELDATIDEMQRENVDALVIDQLGNAGGNFVFGYALLSRLVSRPVPLPRQRYVVSGSGSIVGFGDARALDRIAEPLLAAKTDDEVAAFMRADPLFSSALNFVPRTVDTSRSAGEFFHFLGEQARSTHPGLTAPYYEFQPALVPDATRGRMFDRPLLLLIDALNISAAEFVASALVDSGRATALGTTTAGGGGDERALSRDRICTTGREHSDDPFADCVPERIATAMKELGVKTFSYTVTIGERPVEVGAPVRLIENRGVDPTIPYEVSEEDLRRDFAPMKQRIVQELSKLR